MSAVSLPAWASPVSVQEELDGVIPVVERLFSEFGCALSVDTSTPQVMRSGGGRSHG